MDAEKVTFTLCIGCQRGEQKETFILEELGIIKNESYETEEELGRLLEEEWDYWAQDLIAGRYFLHK
jgi:hypothetical protein